jgi:hypothetical protein
MALEDRLVSMAALAVAAGLGWATVAAPPGRSAPMFPGDQYWRLDSLDSRVRAVTQAIAQAEGYYATGEHDGRSLPYRLNNPGALKKPALGAERLPTWKDTGLVVFPNPEMGWAALQRQVCLMLTGASEQYDATDTWVHVALKYADGDRNWGANVAATLGVSPASTLGELAEPAAAGGGCETAAN